MSTKRFLPDIEMNEIYKETVYPLTKQGGKNISKNCIVKFISTMIFLGFLAGSTTLGFSMNIVGTNHVGYYQNETGYFNPGTYFQFPWVKEKMHIVAIGDRTLHLDDLHVTINGSVYEIDRVKVSYSVSSVDTFVRSLKKHTPGYTFEPEIREVVKSEIEYLSKDELFAKKEFEDDIPMSDYGITVREIKVSYQIKKSRKMN